MRPSDASVAVRQQPSIATESPTLVAAAVSGASTSSRTPSGPPYELTTRPRSLMIPVNTPPRLLRSVFRNASVTVSDPGSSRQDPAGLAEGERLEGLADEHLVLAAVGAELGEELLDRLGLGRRQLVRADRLYTTAELVVGDVPREPLRQQRDDLVVGAMDCVRARGHRRSGGRHHRRGSPRNGRAAASLPGRRRTAARSRR